MQRVSRGLQAFFVGLLLVSMTGCENGNLFGGLHKTGSGGSAALQSDAAIALRNRDFSAALNLYNELLASDPSNAEALYGASAAALGASGLKLGDIIANILQQNGSVGTSNITNVGEIISASRDSVHSNSTNVNSILAGIDLTRLSAELPTIRARLQKLLKGETNLAVLPTSADLRINSAVLFLIDAAVTAIDNNILDIVNDNGDYTIEKGTAFSSICSGNPAVVKRIGSDLIVSYILLNRVVMQLGLGNSKIITRSREDIKSVLDDLLKPGSAHQLDAACVSTLDDIGITYGAYDSYIGWLY